MLSSLDTSPIYLPIEVLKRDGSKAEFDAAKIKAAILKAGQATGEFDELEAQLLTAQVVKVLAHTGYRQQLPEIERIQDIVEQVLISANHHRTARAYIVYREQHKKLREDRKTLVNVATSVNEYLEQADWRVNANANQGYSLGGLILNTSGKMIANYWLSHVYPPEIGQAHREGDARIEAWMADQTRDELLETLVGLDSRTRIVMAGSNLFNGAWAIPFAPEETVDWTFRTGGSQYVHVRMMHATESYDYHHTDDHEAVGMNFSDSRFGLLLLRPDYGGLDDLQETVTRDGIDAILDLLAPTVLEIYLPRFSLSFSENMTTELSDLGLAALFDEDSADFSRIHPADRLFVNLMEHDTRMVFNETAVTASSCTIVDTRGLEEIPEFYNGPYPGGGGTGASSFIISPVSPGFGMVTEALAFDRPFLAVIYDKESHAVIYLGRILDPTG